MPIPRQYRAQEQPRVLLDFKPGDIAVAESRANDGDLRLAADLCEKIIADDRVSGTLRHRTSLVRLPIEFVDGDDAVAELLRSGEYWKLVPSQNTANFLRWFALLGVAYGRFEWVDPDGRPVRRDGRHAPSFRAWHPRALRWDWYGRKWLTRTGRGGAEVEVTPGRDGWVLMTMGSERPWSAGAWRAVARWVLLKDYAVHDWARASEKMGLPGIGIAPRDGSMSDPDRKQLAKDIKNMGGQNAMAFGSPVDIHQFELPASTGELFSKQIESANVGISIPIVGQNLTSEVQGGSHAAARALKQVAAEIIDADATALSETIRSQMLVPWAGANFGDPGMAPWPEYQLPSEDITDRAESWKTLGEALGPLQTGLSKHGLELNLEAIAESAGLPVQELSNAVSGALTQPVSAPAAPSPPPAQQPEKPDTEDMTENAQALARRLILAAKPDGAMLGQGYIDAVVDRTRDRAADLLSADVAAVIEIIRDAESYDEIRQHLRAHYGERMDPEQLGVITAHALQLSQLAAIQSVRLEHPELDEELSNGEP